MAFLSDGRRASLNARPAWLTPSGDAQSGGSVAAGGPGVTATTYPGCDGPPPPACHWCAGPVPWTGSCSRPTPMPTVNSTFDDPYELLVATILSAQCTDERVNQVTPALFAKYPDPAALAAADRADLEEHHPVHGLLPEQGRVPAGDGRGGVREVQGRDPAADVGTRRHCREWAARPRMWCAATPSTSPASPSTPTCSGCPGGSAGPRRPTRCASSTPSTPCSRARTARWCRTG